MTIDLNPSGEMLRIGARIAGTRVLGPRRRFAVWVQGCPFAYPGCVAPTFLPEAGGDLVAVAKLANEILSTPDLDGVTLSGGSQGCSNDDETAPRDTIGRRGRRLRGCRDVDPWADGVLDAGFYGVCRAQCESRLSGTSRERHCREGEKLKNMVRGASGRE